MPNAATCKSCKAPIVWMKTKKGKDIPVDAATVPPDATVFELSRGMKAHFSSCPAAAQFRRTKP